MVDLSKQMLLETTRLVDMLSHKYEEIMQTGGGTIKQQLSFLIEEVGHQKKMCACFIVWIEVLEITLYYYH